MCWHDPLISSVKWENKKKLPKLQRLTANVFTIVVLSLIWTSYNVQILPLVQFLLKIVKGSCLPVGRTNANADSIQQVYLMLFLEKSAWLIMQIKSLSITFVLFCLPWNTENKSSFGKWRPPSNIQIRTAAHITAKLVCLVVPNRVYKWLLLRSHAFFTFFWIRRIELLIRNVNDL